MHQGHDASGAAVHQGLWSFRGCGASGSMMHDRDDDASRSAVHQGPQCIMGHGASGTILYEGPHSITRTTTYQGLVVYQGPQFN